MRPRRRMRLRPRRRVRPRWYARLRLRWCARLRPRWRMSPWLRGPRMPRLPWWMWMQWMRMGRLRRLGSLGRLLFVMGRLPTLVLTGALEANFLPAGLTLPVRADGGVGDSTPQMRGHACR